MSANVPSPFDYPEVWDSITVNGVISPGGVYVSGWKRGTGWDEKNGKGTKGATLTKVSSPPANGKFLFITWNTESFNAVRDFVAAFKSPPTGAPSTADANSIYHPALDQIDVTQIVTHKIRTWEGDPHEGYTIEIEAIEWVPPPPQSIVTTVNAAAATAASIVGTQPDPAVVALQAKQKATIAAAQAAYALPPL